MSIKTPLLVVRLWAELRTDSTPACGSIFAGTAVDAAATGMAAVAGWLLGHKNLMPESPQHRNVPEALCVLANSAG